MLNGERKKKSQSLEEMKEKNIPKSRDGGKPLPILLWVDSESTDRMVFFCKIFKYIDFNMIKF